jgi:hypothetical protein
VPGEVYARVIRAGLPAQAGTGALQRTTFAQSKKRLVVAR